MICAVGLVYCIAFVNYCNIKTAKRVSNLPLTQPLDVLIWWSNRCANDRSIDTVLSVLFLFFICTKFYVPP